MNFIVQNAFAKDGQKRTVYRCARIGFDAGYFGISEVHIRQSSGKASGASGENLEKQNQMGLDSTRPLDRRPEVIHAKSSFQGWYHRRVEQ